MKYLSDYCNEAQTKAFNEAGAFFAFSNEQFARQKKDGINYVSMYAGLICPKENVKKLNEDLEAIHTKGIEMDLADNGKDAIILRELKNYECFYTGDIDDCVIELEDYKISVKEIKAVFKREYAAANA